jgi:hypothetical protein
MSGKLMSADDKRNRKNEMARIRRANSKNAVMDTEQTERPEPDSVPDPEPELPEPEPTPPTAEDIDRQRKEAIAEKRRQSLIIARSKITPKNVIRKEAIDKVNKKDMELEAAKKEAQEIKRKSYEEAEATKKKAAEDVEVMKSLVKTKIISDAEPKKKEKIRSKSVVPRMRETPLPPPPPPPVPQVPQVSQDLIQLSYTEQLKRRVREHQYASAMHDTFG